MGRLGSWLWKALFYLVIVIIIAVILMPIVWAVFLSFREDGRMFDPPWRLPLNFTVNNFTNKILTPAFLKAIQNSFVIALFTTVFTVALGVPAGFALARWEFKGKKILLWFILLLRMAPPIGFAIPLFLVYVRFMLVDTYPAIVSAYMTFTLPLVIWLFTMFMTTIPKELFESAEIDGAGIWKSFIKISVPLSRAGLLSSCVLAFGACWNDFFYALIITRRNLSPGTVAVMNFVTYAGFDWGGVAAACLVLIIPAIPIAFVMQKYLASGFMSGAVKG